MRSADKDGETQPQRKGVPLVGVSESKKDKWRECGGGHRGKMAGSPDLVIPTGSEWTF